MAYKPNIDEMMFFDGKSVSLSLYETFAEKLFALFPDTGTVSYTHLDVYKRQFLQTGFWRNILLRRWFFQDQTTQKYICLEYTL